MLMPSDTLRHFFTLRMTKSVSFASPDGIKLPASSRGHGIASRVTALLLARYKGSLEIVR